MTARLRSDVPRTTSDRLELRTRHRVRRVRQTGRDRDQLCVISGRGLRRVFLKGSRRGRVDVDDRIGGAAAGAARCASDWEAEVATVRLRAVLGHDELTAGTVRNLLEVLRRARVVHVPRCVPLRCGHGGAGLGRRPDREDDDEHEHDDRQRRTDQDGPTRSARLRGSLHRSGDRAPDHRRRGERLGETLQVEGTDRTELVTATRSDEATHEVAHQRLTRLRGRAQTRLPLPGSRTNRHAPTRLPPR